MVKVYNTSVSTISNEESLRFDVDYLGTVQLYDNYYSFGDLFSIRTDTIVKKESLIDDFLYCEIGNVDKQGNVFPLSLNFDERSLEDESYYKKIEKGDILKADKDDILIAKVRPNLRKYVRITDEIKDIFFTTAFIHIKPKIMPEIMYYSFRSLFYDNLMSITRQGKGYPTLNETDIFQLRFKREHIDNLIAKETYLAKVVRDTESKILECVKKRKNTRDIIDAVFEKEFGIHIESIREICEKKQIDVSFQRICENSNNILRFSYRWNAAVMIQSILQKDVDCCEELDGHITSTKNGWSPECADTASAYRVLALDALGFDTRVDLEKSKFSDSTDKNIDSYELHEDDFLVSRGNGTDDLVALASVVHFEEEHVPCIYPDIMIRITFDDQIDKEYMAYVFNSSIGRYYFKYVSKGSNKKKITPVELKQFVVPLPDINEQRRIVKLVDEEITKQDLIQHEIQTLYGKLEKTIIEVAEGKSVEDLLGVGSVNKSLQIRSFLRQNP